MKLRKAVFPAAGLGTRFLPATKAQPKEMLPLVDKPIIQYVIEEAVAAGLTNIIIVTGRGKNAIEDHFDVSYELEKLLEERGKHDLLEQVRAISSMINVSYVRQGETLGLGHAVLVARDLVGDEPFAVMLGDDIIDAPVPCMRQMVDVFEKVGDPVVAVYRVPPEDISAYGVIDGVPETEDPRVYRIRDMVEKPPPDQAPSDLAIIGRYILTPDIFHALETTPRDAGGEIQLTNGIRALRKHRRVYGYRFDGVRHDAGNKLGFLKATVEFALKREDLGGPFRDYLRSLEL
jgi:UTP--glucose-1-phosphate uridylyltransferase